MTVRTRFAPSPTGVLHIGSVRTALFCWLHARHFGGQYVLRIEDTDRERSTPQNVEAILDGLSWLGLDADEGPFYQSERFDRYREVIDQWLEEGKAYNCYCTREEHAGGLLIYPAFRTLYNDEIVLQRVGPGSLDVALEN